MMDMDFAGEELRGGVVGSMFAEGEDGGGDGGMGGFDEGVDEHSEGGEGGEGAGGGEDDDPAAAAAREAEEKIDGRKGSKEFREWLKTQEATPEGAKFAKTARADHFRMQELATIEPGGITAVREKYALMEAVGGAEGFTRLQERAAGADATDEALMSGDPKALADLGPDFDPGLAKLTPTILDRVMKSDPQAYAAAILPHLMSGLAGSPMVGDLNKMVDALTAAHLDDAGKVKAVTALLGSIGKWFEANEKKAGELKTAPVDKGRETLNEERSKFEQEQQAAHWKNNITPAAAQAERGKFDELLKPYMTRLKLTDPQKAAALTDFRGKLTTACKADPQFMKQMAIYRKQKNPDAATVSNFLKVNLAKKAQAAFDAVKAERWGNFLQGAKPKPAGVAGARAASGTPGAAPTVVSVKPAADEIDYRRTSEADQWKGIYTLKSGKQVKWVKPQ